MRRLTEKEFKFVSELIWGGTPINDDGNFDMLWAEGTKIYKEKAPQILAQYPLLDKSFFKPLTHE